MLFEDSHQRTKEVQRDGLGREVAATIGKQRWIQSYFSSGTSKKESTNTPEHPRAPRSAKKDSGD
jgi:hypothetical protein